MVIFQICTHFTIIICVKFPEIPAECNEGWQSVYGNGGTTCLLVVNEAKSWDDAQDRCLCEGGTMVSIIDLGVNTVIANLMMQLYVDTVKSRYTLNNFITLQWRHNKHDSVSNHQPNDCLLNRLFRRRSKKTSKLRVTGLCAWNSPVTGEFPAQRASNAENVSIWWRHRDGNNFSRFIPQIPQCNSQISHNVSCCNRYTFLLHNGAFWVMGQVYCGIYATGLLHSDITMKLL